ILLLDVGAVVLAVRPTAGERDPLEATVVEQRAIDEFRAVIGVHPAEAHGQPPADLVQRGADAFVAVAPDRLQFDPARRDIDGAEGMQEEPATILTAVGHQIDLEEAWPRVIPVGERADRDLMLEPSPGLRRAPASSRSSVEMLICRTRAAVAGRAVSSTRPDDPLTPTQ